MRQQALGKSGIAVSRLCFGTLTIGPIQANLPVAEGGALIAQAIRAGINFFDTAQLYETYPYLQEGMRQAGTKEIVISSKTYAYTRELAIEAVEDARKALDRDVVDIFMLHEQESIHTLRGHTPALEYLYDCKAKGIIRAVGASMHHVAAVEGAIRLGLDVIHPLLNKNGLGIVDGDRRDMEAALQKAHEMGIGIFSMKPLGGGNLFKEAETCLSYILGKQYVDSVAVGIQSPEELEANLSFWETGSFSPKQAQALKIKRRRLHIDDWCEGCGACVSRCGQNALSLSGGKAVCDHGKCILCGYCSAVCPAWAIKVV